MASPFPNILEDPLKELLTTVDGKVTLLQNQIDAVKTVNKQLFGGNTFVAATGLSLRSLVRFNSSGQLIAATDTDMDGSAIGMIDAPVSAGASVAIYGSGISFSDVGLSGTTDGTELFLGTNGECTVSRSGSPRLIQKVGIVVGGQCVFDFNSVGVWVAS